MKTPPKEKPIKKSEIELAGQDLFNYAIERDDVKYLLTLLPQEATVSKSKVEYELQLLKIITVGWSISYHLQDNPLKDLLPELFWQAVNQFSQGLSETTGLMIGQDIDYFELLKKRLDTYLAAMHKKCDGHEPSNIIGSAFARACGNADDIFAVMAGTKMFTAVTTRVHQYLEALWLKPLN